MIGMTLGHYQITEKLGEGGMGEVYKAFDTRLQRPVAIKRLLPELASDEDYRRRFLKEAQHAASLTHQCIAGIYDILEENGDLLLVMEYVDGRTILDCRLNNESMDEFLSLARQSVEALVTAHQHGLVHRDLKPGNIMLTPGHKVKLLDFGLARKIDFVSQASTPSDVSTEHGKVQGTPAYMAPEVLMGRPADPRSDIFSLGVVFYEVLAGRHPFADATLAAMTHRILSEPTPSMTRFNPAVPEDLERILGRMLDKDPDSRYATAVDLLADLRRYLRDHSYPSFPLSGSTPARKHRYGLAAAGILIVALLVGLGLRYGEDLLGRLGILSLPANPTVAVLPITYRGESQTLLSFCGGLTEQWNLRLCRLAATHPISILPRQLLRARRVTRFEEIGREVGANLALTATVEEVGRDLRLYVVVLGGRGGRVLRRNRMIGTIGDPMTLDLQLAETGWKLLGMPMSPKERRELAEFGTNDPLAYNRYLQGLGLLWHSSEPKHHEEAVRALQEAALLDPSYSQALAAIGQASLQVFEDSKEPRWLEKSLSSCGEAARLRPRLAEAQICLGETFRAKGDPESAVTALNRARSYDPGNMALLEELGDLNGDLGRNGEAEQAYKMVVQQKPEYWRGYSTIGYFYFTHARWDEAEQAYRKATELAPDYYRAFMSLCAVYGELYRWEDSQRACERSLEIYEHGGAYTNLATAYFQRGMYAQAVSAAKNAIIYLDKTESDSYQEYGNLADILYWTPGEREGASEYFRKALDKAQAYMQKMPRDPAPASARIALYLAMIGQKSSSLDYLDRALRMEGDNPEILFKAAQIHQQFDDREKTLGSLRAALDKGLDKRKVLFDPRFRILKDDPEFQKMLGNR